mmetsp:Transcript_15009/g.30258  ORF Transcript_15009/g.30258 Transcript_15009/m.30258 type:complete len:211 (+) Transcript_15009:848-1480(+)
MDGEGPAVGEPGDDVGQAIPLDLIEEVVKLAGEGDGDLLLPLAATSAGALLLAEDGSLDVLGGRLVSRRDLPRVIVVVVLDEVPLVHLGGHAWLLRLADPLRLGLGRGNVDALHVLALEGLELVPVRARARARARHGAAGAASGSLSLSRHQIPQLLLLLPIVVMREGGGGVGERGDGKGGAIPVHDGGTRIRGSSVGRERRFLYRTAAR